MSKVFFVRQGFAGTSFVYLASDLTLSVEEYEEQHASHELAAKLSIWGAPATTQRVAGSDADLWFKGYEFSKASFEAVKVELVKKGWKLLPEGEAFCKLS